MRVYSKSDIGLRRTSNQDYCKTGSFPDGTVWAVVCDGMGGANGGCTASSVSAETIASYLCSEYNEGLDDGELRALMEEAVRRANTEVYNMAQGDDSLYGMGTTVICATVKNGRAHIVHAGDSRAYLYDGEKLYQITTDHSFVQELVNIGKLTREQARVHPERNLITRALGIEPTLETDYNSVEFTDNSLLLICTDGMSEYITDDMLSDYINNYGEEELIDKLISCAKELGGSDNITVAVIAGRS